MTQTPTSATRAECLNVLHASACKRQLSQPLHSSVHWIVQEELQTLATLCEEAVGLGEETFHPLQP